LSQLTLPIWLKPDDNALNIINAYSTPSQIFQIRYYLNLAQEDKAEKKELEGVELIFVPKDLSNFQRCSTPKTSSYCKKYR